jgi:2-amino-4-hydroxy-6-hydroxymethyldihydropteridine diphosphokinase
MSAMAYIGLGSNLGDRRGHLEKALDELGRTPGVSVRRVSTFIDTAPVGGPPGQMSYLNAVAEIQTDLSAAEVLRALLAIEAALGRVRAEKYGPRTIDLDLLLHGSGVVDQPGLFVPHPHMHERRFVLAPLVEIAPDVRHPLSGKSARELLSALDRTTSEKLAAENAGPVHDPVKVTRQGSDLRGRRALVTGSTGGIGRAIALELAAAGADVLVHGRRIEAAHEVARTIRETGARSEAVIADLRDQEQRVQVIEAARTTWGGVDLLVNNAGADTLTGPPARWSFEKKLDELLAVDVIAAIHLSRSIGALMKQRATGVIVNVGWDQAETGMEGDSGQLFAVAKGAIMAFTRSLALALAPEVRVNCIAPGWIQTAWGESASARWSERVHRETPLARWGKPEDVARVARWLASPAAAFLTGQVIRVNGGAVR